MTRHADERLIVNQGNVRSPFIDLRGLCKAYSSGDTRVDVLKGLDFQARPGEAITVVGVSGTGKSTLLNIIGGIDVPDTGSVHVNGTDVHTLSERDMTAYRRDIVGFIFQFYNLIPSLTAHENVLAALEATGTINSADTRALAMLKAVGLADKSTKFPEQLSGGEQQRVAIARALVKTPPLILADEPTGNLDPVTGEKILALLIEQVRATHATLVIITHNPAIGALTDRTLRLEQGRLVSLSD